MARSFYQATMNAFGVMSHETEIAVRVVDALVPLVLSLYEDKVERWVLIARQSDRATFRFETANGGAALFDFGREGPNVEVVSFPDTQELQAVVNLIALIRRVRPYTHLVDETIDEWIETNKTVGQTAMAEMLNPVIQKITDITMTEEERLEIATRILALSALVYLSISVREVGWDHPKVQESIDYARRILEC